MSEKPAARLGDPVAHTMALPGALIGLGIGLLAGAAIIATGGLGAIAIGGALAVAGGSGLAGQYIGESKMGPATGAIAMGSPNVLINMRPASATVLGLASCSMEGGIPQAQATGAETVLINMMPAGRVDEKIVCSALITAGSPNVMIGGPSVQVLPMKPEVPVWLSTGMKVMAIGGLLIATGGSIAAYGLGPTLAYTALGFGGGHLGALGGRALGEHLGLGETWTRTFEVLGGFAGGAAAVRGGQWFNRNYQVRVDPNRLGMNGGNLRITPRPGANFQKPTTGAWRNAPNTRKWLDRGGTIHQNRDGSVTYTNRQGQAVTYDNRGYPDFSPHRVDSTTLPGGFQSRSADFRAANNQTGRGQYGDRSPPGQTWHHHEDGVTMELLPRALHRQFTHAGGISNTHGTLANGGASGGGGSGGGP
ncbi:HNH endonuclease [Vannielia litorea]|uniref:Zn-binding Pro-Ala-Ala-Arg (PAAR) domain-containing protein, incolved in TypeVI secretion n=1 Tax=Vannielia litorea TaxID=1217970 RepID=A0A1N6ICV9_9RHOB|nr:HNH endonuclease [Vannielia litorea]SIO29874.1 Zn-binding Pro-Ala-Ala-Arg (PAAR) domain-containing protein, incolved in TypeVI secretion [Vannielia litorea]